MKFTTAFALAATLGATAFATPALAQSQTMNTGHTVATQQLQVTPQHPNRMVGGQAMPVFGAAFSHVSTNAADLRDLHPGYRGFISDGK